MPRSKAGKSMAPRRWQRYGVRAHRASRMVMLAGWPTLAASVGLAVAVAAVAAGEVESTRLSDDDFRKGLLELKLIDLLEYHLQHYPPADELTERLIRRDIKLNVARDPAGSPKARRAALAEANKVLASIIDSNRDDKRVIDWKLSLAKSLIFEQAEPNTTSILYHGGTATDRLQLLALTQQTINLLADLTRWLEAEYARLDELSVAEYERLDEGGHIARLETALPQAQQMLRWARFHRAIALDNTAPERRDLLQAVLSDLVKNTTLLTDDQTMTPLRAQSLLLAGMAARRLGDQTSALRYLQDAVSTANAARNPQERADLQWVAVLGAVERVRALADDGRFEEAAQALATFRKRAESAEAGRFGLQLVTALLDSDVQRAHADQLRREGNAAQADTAERSALDPLISLAGQQESYREEIYAMLYRRLRDAPDVPVLHPFERCALIAGHLAEAQRLRSLAATVPDDSAGDQPDRRALEAQATALLDQAINLAQQTIADQTGIDEALHCEAQFNLGAAQFHRGLRLDAAVSFADVVERCPHLARARTAAGYAVEIASQLHEDPTLRARPEVQEVYHRAIRSMVEGFPGTEESEYWRFFWGQALEEQADYDRASEVYRAVGERHEQYLAAQFRAARCQVAAIKSYVATHADDRREVQRRVNAARQALDRFQTLAKAVPPKSAAEPGRETATGDMNRPLAECPILRAEMDVLPEVDRAAEAIEMLAGFEQRYPERGDLMGRVLRTRVLAYEALGRLDEARQAVPQYLASAPAEAAATVQALFDSTRAEIERCRQQGRSDLAERKARAALMLAEELYRGVGAAKNPVDNSTRYLLRLQLAEACLEAGRLTEAVEHLRACNEEAGAQYPDGVSRDTRAAMDLAEALYRSGQFAEALPLANRIYQALPTNSPERYRALLRDLQCRTQLHEDAKAIIDVIRQHRYLDPELGGAELRKQFEELLRQNEQRTAGGK